MGEYAFYSFNDEALLKLGITLLPIPIRREMEQQVFGEEKVRVGLIIDELYLFLNENPELRDLYDSTMETLTWMAGMNAGMEGDAEASARYLEMGLDTSPDSLLLRSNYALALQLQGQGEDALEQYEVVLADPEGQENPMVRLLAARLYAEQEEYLEAYKLLDEMARGVPTSDAFWNFLAEMRKLAGVEEEVGTKAAEVVARPRKAFCTSCGRELVEGMKFCKGCGKPVAEMRESQLSCPDCGRPLPPGTKFCRSCGKQMAAGASGSHACTSCGKELLDGMKFCRGCGKPV